MNGIYLIQNKDQLVEMIPQNYESEDVLQEFLEKYPQLLSSVLAKKLLFIKSQMLLKSAIQDGDKWTIDFLFVDEDAVPILVNVTRNNSTENRRKILGEMLDYAANAILNLPVEKIITNYQANCQNQSQDHHQILSDFIGADLEQNDFWSLVEHNCSLGKICLVFLADEISIELEKIVEFMNTQMNPTEVLAVEIKQYSSEWFSTIIPRVIGLTSKMKSGSIYAEKQWDETTFFEHLQQKQDLAQLTVAQDIYQWAKEHSLLIEWSKNSKFPAFFINLEYKGKKFKPIEVLAGTSMDESNAIIQLNFAELKNKPPFEDETKRMKLLYRLNDIRGIHIPETKIEGYPSIPLSSLKEQMVLTAFLDTIDWVIREIKST